MRLAYEQTVLAHFQAIYDRRRQRLRQIDQPILDSTPMRSP